MANFKYKVRNNMGQLNTGSIEACSKDVVADELKKMGYVPVSIEEGDILPDSIRNIKRLFNKVSLEELVVFTQELMTLQRAGVPILTSLEAISAEITNIYFKGIIKEIYHHVECGKSLNESLAMYPRVFSGVYVNMVKAGETAGILDNVLERLSMLYEHERELRMKIQQAVRYPLLVIAVIIIAFLSAVLFIIPKFSMLFARFNTNLPFATKLLLWAHRLLTDYWILLAGSVIGLFILGRKFIAAEKGRYAWDNFKLKIPVFGNIFLKISMSRFSRMTALLCASGIPIINTLEIVSGFMDNRMIEKAVNNIIKDVGDGKGIAEPMRKSGYFPVVVTQMVRIGEETGKIEELLLKVSEYYDRQVEYTVKNLTVLIEPILIFILGMMVLILALGIFMPMWNMIEVFRH